MRKARQVHVGRRLVGGEQVVGGQEVADDVAGQQAAAGRVVAHRLQRRAVPRVEVDLALPLGEHRREGRVVDEVLRRREGRVISARAGLDEADARGDRRTPRPCRRTPRDRTGPRCAAAHRGRRRRATPGRSPPDCRASRCRRTTRTRRCSRGSAGGAARRSSRTGRPVEVGGRARRPARSIRLALSPLLSGAGVGPGPGCQGYRPFAGRSSQHLGAGRAAGARLSGRRGRSRRGSRTPCGWRRPMRARTG